MISTSLLEGLGRFLNFSVSRHEAIAANMANLDTPGYKTRDLSFRTALGAAWGEDGEPLFRPIATRVPGLIERPDGNNVNLERESLLMAQNQLLFTAGVQALKSEFRRISMAIKEGT
jgi:flagellar basal-body rod protein FlgB